jgi:hypothetical protein
MTFLAGLYPKHENVNEISNGRWKYSYKETHNNICVAVSFERDCLDNSPVKLAYVDLNLDLAKAMTVLNPTMYLDSVISSLHRRNFERAEIFANSKSGEDIDAQWLRVWKGKRCLHLGLPNRAAMLLLTGLTKRINIDYRQGQAGSWVPDGTISKIRQANLISELSFIPKKRRSGFMTNERGYHILLHWAENRKGFAKFFDAYCPKNWERDYLARQVFEKMSGNQEGC